MDMPGALRARLLAAAPVTALVAQRIYWVERPQSSALPAITLQVITELRDQHMQGFDGLTMSRVQLDAWALSFGSAKAIAEAALAALVPAVVSNGIEFQRAFSEGPTNSGEPTETQFIHRSRIDFIIHHSVQ